MNDLLQTAFDMWRPYYFEYSENPMTERAARWANFVQNIHYNVEAFGDIERIDVKGFDNLCFCDKIGYPICIFNPWRSSLGFYGDEREEFYKSHPEEPERLRTLLKKAEALLSVQKMTAPPIAKLATA